MTNREKRIQHASALSQHHHTADEICLLLRIDKATLKRYTDTELWRKSGGDPNLIPKPGRPKGNVSQEIYLFKQASGLHTKGLKWTKIASMIGISENQLRYIRRKHQS